MILPIIINELYIGDRHSVQATDFIKNTVAYIFDSSDITITIQMSEFYKKHNIVYIKSYTTDNEAYDIISEFDKNAYLFACKEIGAILFMCDCAISRSVSYVMLYLLKMNQTDLHSALTLTQKMVSNMSPNIGFVKQLVHCEKTLFGTNTLTIKDYIRQYFRRH